MSGPSRRAARGLLMILVLVGWLPPVLLVADRPVADPDAIIILGSHEWERLPAAVAVAERWLRAQVVLTVPNEVTPHNCADCGRRPAWLNALGVDGGRIVEVPLRQHGGTWGEAQVVLAHARAAGWRRLIVVTSAFHTRRSLMTFRRAAAGTGVEIGVVSAEHFSTLAPRWWWASIEGWWYVAYESAAIVKYAALGRLGS